MNASLNANMDRQKYLGSSDVAGILGISPWKTPLDVYLDKIQPRVEESDPARLRVLTRGKLMEPYVTDILSQETGVCIVARGNRYIDPELPFIAAEIDAECVANGDAQTLINIEIKTVSPFKAREWGEQQTDEIPVHYTAQVMHQLMVTRRDTCMLGVLIGGDDFRVYRVERDDEIIAAIRAREVEFWQRVQEQNPPEPTSVSDIARLYGTKDSGAAIEANDQIETSYFAMRSIDEDLKRLTKAYEEHKEHLQLYMADASILTLRGSSIATWKEQSSTRFDQKAFGAAHPDLLEQFKKSSTSRVFRLK